MSCWQCDLDIPHVCYAGMPNARWGLGDEAMTALETLRHMIAAGEDFEQAEIAVDLPVRLYLRPLQVEQLVKKLAKIMKASR